MLKAIPRYGARIIPKYRANDCRRFARQDSSSTGPHIAEFERAFAARMGANYAVATSYGRMAFYYLLEALQLPKGSEIILPALTFWVIPELARVAGLKPVFADVDPRSVYTRPVRVSNARSPRAPARSSRRISTDFRATSSGSWESLGGMDLP